MQAATDQDALTPEEIETLARDKALAAECKKYRMKLREAERRIAQLTRLTQELSAFLKASGAVEFIP